LNFGSMGPRKVPSLNDPVSTEYKMKRKQGQMYSVNTDYVKVPIFTQFLYYISRSYLNLTLWNHNFHMFCPSIYPYAQKMK